MSKSPFGDGFPDAKYHFQRAFADSNPTHCLLQILNRYQDVQSVNLLVISYFKAVRNDPSRAQFLASALANVRNSLAPTFETDTFGEVLCRLLDGFHFKFYEDDSAGEYGPTNAYLVDSFLSGLLI
jgi:hypothetical protein